MSSQVRLRLGGPDTGIVALWEWLRAEPELRGRVTREAVPSPLEAMGSIADLVVTLASSGTAAVLARSLQVWLTQRHSDVKVTVTRPGGEEVTVDVRRGERVDAEQLLHAITDITVDVPSSSSPSTPQST